MCVSVVFHVSQVCLRCLQSQVSCVTGVSGVSHLFRGFRVSNVTRFSSVSRTSVLQCVAVCCSVSRSTRPRTGRFPIFSIAR